MANDIVGLKIVLDGTGTEIPTLSVTGTYNEYLLTGSVTTIGNYAIVPTGTPQYGTTFVFRSIAVVDITTNGNTFAIFGQQITQAQLLKTWTATCYYTTSWKVYLSLNLTETGVISTANIADLAVTTVKINNLAVTSGKLADDSVITAKILDLNVTTAKVNDLAVTDAKLAADSVITAKILANNVTNAKLAQMAANTIKMNNTGVLADPQDVTVSSLINTNAWSTTGNSGTVAVTNFLGTTDNISLAFKVNNVDAGGISTAATSNISIGYNAMVISTAATQCVGVGTNALTNKTSSYGCTAVGHSSLLDEVSGNYNTGIGAFSGNAITTGIENTCLGALSGNILQTGNYNTYLGGNADGNSTSALNRIALGHNAVATSDYQFALPSNVTSWKIRGNSFTLPSADGGVKAALITNGSGTLSFGSIIDSGTYTPTLTNGTNVAGSTAYLSQYLRVGSQVTVSGKVNINPTSTGATEMGISLPIASNFGNDYECAGVANFIAIAGESAGILADAANNRASLQYIAVDIADKVLAFTFTYTII
jgi:hypothetical protein